MRHAVIDEPFARLVRDANAQLDLSIRELLDESSAPYEFANLTNIQEASPCFDAEYSDESNPAVPRSGDRIEVYWPTDNQFYPGTVNSASDGKHTVNYDDCDIENLTMTNDTGQYASSAVVRPLYYSTPNFTSTMTSLLSDMKDFFGNRPSLVLKLRFSCNLL